MSEILGIVIIVFTYMLSVLECSMSCKYYDALEHMINIEYYEKNVIIDRVKYNLINKIKKYH